MENAESRRWKSGECDTELEEYLTEVRRKEWSFLDQPLSSYEKRKRVISFINKYVSERKSDHMRQIYEVVSGWRPEIVNVVLLNNFLKSIIAERIFQCLLLERL